MKCYKTHEGTANVEIIAALVASISTAAFAIKVAILTKNGLNQVAVDVAALSATLVVAGKESNAIVGFLETDVSSDKSLSGASGFN